MPPPHRLRRDPPDGSVLQLAIGEPVALECQGVALEVQERREGGSFLRLQRQAAAMLAAASSRGKLIEFPRMSTVAR